MAAVSAAAVAAAGMAALTVLVVVVAAVNIGVIAQIAAQQRVHRRVRLAAGAAIEPDVRFCQRRLRAATDSTAEQGIHALPHQKIRQRAVAAAVGIDDFRTDNSAVRRLIDFKLLRVAEMLENPAVFIGNRNFYR